MKPDQIFGMSPSAFKTLLRKRGHKVNRNFFQHGVSKKFGRLYRWRWWSDPQMVDVSCPKEDFDRWANSIERSVPFAAVLAQIEKETGE